MYFKDYLKTISIIQHYQILEYFYKNMQSFMKYEIKGMLSTNCHTIIVLPIVNDT